MEREYDKTLDLSRGQGTGMQSFERENGKHQSNVISLRREYLQLSRNFSRLWPLCPCHRLGVTVWANELGGAAPATACIKCVSDTLMLTRHKWFGHAVMAIQAVTHTALAVLLPAHSGMGLHVSALPCVPSQGTGTMMHIPHWLPKVWFLRAGFRMASSNPQSFVRGVLVCLVFFFPIDLYIVWNKNTD